MSNILILLLMSAVLISRFQSDVIPTIEKPSTSGNTKPGSLELVNEFLDTRQSIYQEIEKQREVFSDDINNFIKMLESTEVSMTTQETILRSFGKRLSDLKKLESRFICIASSSHESYSKC